MGGKLRIVAIPLLVSAILLVAGISEGANFYRENRNGRVFILQDDPNSPTKIATVFNHAREPIFVAPNAKRIAVLPTAGWYDYTSNVVPAGSPEGKGEFQGDPYGVITLRLERSTDNKRKYSVYRGPDSLLYDFIDQEANSWDRTTEMDIAVSQYVGAIVNGQNVKDTLRVYVYLSKFNGGGPFILRLEFKQGVAKPVVRFRFTQAPNVGNDPFNKASQSWGEVVETGNISTAQAINVNSASPTVDLLVYHPNRRYSLQHVWAPQVNNGNSWGINYLMDDNRVMKANLSNPLTNEAAQMSQIFDVGVDLGDAFVDTLLYYRSYYYHGNTFVANNVNTNTSLPHIYYDIRDPAGQNVEIRDGGPHGAVLETVRVNPNPTVLGHHTTSLYGLSCRNALTGTELIVYEPVYKINPAAVAMNEITDNDRNNVPDHVDNDGKGYWGYRQDYLIDRPNGSSLNTDYILDFVIAHRFPLKGITADTELTYREYAIERDPATTPAALKLGDVVHIRVGNIAHRDPDIYGEYFQYGWNSSPGNAIFFFVAKPGLAYAAQTNTTAEQYGVARNSGHILGVEVKSTSYATADFFGVVGTDDYNQGQGDLYFLARQYGAYIKPQIVARYPGAPDPPVSGYYLWWKFQYERSTYYGISQTKWLSPTDTVTKWINQNSFFIGNSLYSQMVYNVNCGCRGQRYENFQLVKEASAKIHDFAIVNIGAPPWVTGGLYPTLIANTGSTVFEPNAKVTFTGNYSGRTDLLSGGGVGFRFVVLKGKFIDSGNPFDEPYTKDGGKKVVDSFFEQSPPSYLASPTWSHTFNTSGDEVASYNVYLGIKYNYQDYSLLPYPAYSWEKVPTKDFFAWSNSKGGSFIDGQYHELSYGAEKFGAPLRITIDSKGGPTPDHPLQISKVEALVDFGGIETSAKNAALGGYVASQTQRLKLRAHGALLFLSEIPEPLESNYVRMGGILPANTRVRMDPSGDQYLKNTSTPLSDTAFNADLGKISYVWYVKAKFQTKEKGPVNFTRTNPTVNRDHLLWRGDDPSKEGYQIIGKGTLDRLNQPQPQVDGFFQFEPPPVQPKSQVSAAYSPSDPYHRRLNFSIDTPWFTLPIPLNGGQPAESLLDKYEFRVAFQYQLGKWTKVTVKNYNSNTLTDSYNSAMVQDIEFAGDDENFQIERSYSAEPAVLPYPSYRWSAAQACLVRIMDTQGPVLSGFTVGNQVGAGDSFPTSDITFWMKDNNPHDYLVRSPLEPSKRNPEFRYVFGTGRDQFLKLNSDESSLDFPYSRFNLETPFEKIPFLTKDSNSTLEKNWFFKNSSVSLSSCSTQLPDSFDAVYKFGQRAEIKYETPSGSPLFLANSLFAPAFNSDAFPSKFFLYTAPGDSPYFNPSSGEPMAFVTDGSNNFVAAGNATHTALVEDNDPPQVRVFLQDQMDLDVMIEVSGGIKDANGQYGSRKLVVKNMKKSDEFWLEGTLATTTPYNPTITFQEVYDIPPVGLSLTKPLLSGKVPLKVNPDSRFKVTALAFDQSNPNSQVPVRLSIPDYDNLQSYPDRYEVVFRRGLTGNTYHVEALAQDPAGNSVLIRIPLEIGQAGNIDVRTIEETTKKRN